MARSISLDFSKDLISGMESTQFFQSATWLKSSGSIEEVYKLIKYFRGPIYYSGAEILVNQYVFPEVFKTNYCLIPRKKENCL